MQTIFYFLSGHPALIAFALTVGVVIIWHVWDFRIRPLFIPKGVIMAQVDELIAKHGPDAEDVARWYEEGAWHRSDTYEQGQWRRVRRELWRRYKAGEWE